MDTPHLLNTGNRLATATADSQVIRTPDQRVRVFVSSTLDELVAERAAAREAITQLRLTPILFESGARPYPPRELYRAYLAQSDIFVGLYWQRYGWVAPTMQVSGLEDEYQLSGGKPKLIYVKTPAPAREPRLQALLDRIRAEGDVSYQKFATPDELRKRLANDLAQLLTERFTSPPETAVPDLSAFLALASLKDPELVEPTVARALGVSEANGQAIGERLLESLRPRALLLLLDAAPRLKVLVTSREPLRVRDERVVTVLPLALPDAERLPDLARLSQVPAVALFVERVREVQPAFALTAENAQAIAEICRRLDGLPLALELAAARSNVLPPEALLARLEHRLPLLTHGARDMPERQQTLRNTIAWSYDLLEESDKTLFRRLAVFSGGFTLEAAEAVCSFAPAGTSLAQADDEGAVLEQLGQLLDKSLVQAQQDTGGEPRFSMLETIHEYAYEQLEASSEAAAMQARHADYFLRLAEEAEPHLFGAEREGWMERLDREQANLRAALAWCMAESNAVQTGLRLVGALAFYWSLRGAVREGRTWLEAMLARTEGSDRSAARGKALVGAGWLAWEEGDDQAASPRAEEGFSIVHEAQDRRLIGRAESLLGLVRFSQRNIAAARPLLEESRTLFKDLGDVWGEASRLYLLGNAAYFSGDRVGTHCMLRWW